MAAIDVVIPEKYTRDWSLTQKLALGGFPPIAMSMIFAYVHWFMPTLDLNTASHFDVFFAQLLVLSPWLLMPIWGWGIFLLMFGRPAHKSETIEQDVPPTFRDSWRGKLYRRLILTISFMAAAVAVPEGMKAGLTQWPLESGFHLIAAFILASLVIAFSRTHCARPQPYDTVDGKVVHRTGLEKLLYIADDVIGGIAYSSVALVAIHSFMAVLR